MSDRVRLQLVVDEFKAGKGKLCCNDVGKLLLSLGFEVKDGKRGGHKVYTHDAIPEFYSGSYNCGHGKNLEIKPAYITKIMRILELHKDALDTYLKSINGGKS